MSAQLPRTVFAVLLGISLAMLLTPGDAVPGGGVDDKLTHLLIFTALAVSGRWAQVPPLTLGIGLAAYAGVTELLQAVLPIDRNGDPRDLLADATGILLGLFLSWIAVRVGRARGSA